MKGERNRMERDEEKYSVISSLNYEHIVLTLYMCVWKSSIRIGRMRASPLYFFSPLPFLLPI